jgi:hypothetical protein
MRRASRGVGLLVMMKVWWRELRFGGCQGAARARKWSMTCLQLCLWLATCGLNSTLNFLEPDSVLLYALHSTTTPLLSLLLIAAPIRNKRSLRIDIRCQRARDKRKSSRPAPPRTPLSGVRRVLHSKLLNSRELLTRSRSLSPFQPETSNSRTQSPFGPAASGRSHEYWRQRPR